MASVQEIDNKIALIEKSLKNFQPYSGPWQRFTEQLDLLKKQKAAIAKGGGQPAAPKSNGIAKPAKKAAKAAKAATPPAGSAAAVKPAPKDPHTRQAADLFHKGDGVDASVYNTAMNAIAATHSFPADSQSGVMVNTGERTEYRVITNASDGKVTREIALRPGAGPDELVHEIAHYLEDQKFLTKQDIKDVAAAGRETQAFKGLKDSYDKKNSEMWARSYTQWVATVAKEAVMQANIQAFGNHWEQSDFESVQKSISSRFDGLTTDGRRVIGYRRVFDGGCAYCEAASHKIYHPSDLMPIHEHCNCGVEPVFDGEPLQGLSWHAPEDGALPDEEIGPRLDQSGPSPGELPDLADADFSDLATESEIDAEFRDFIDGLAPETQDALLDYGSKDAFDLLKDMREGDDYDHEWVADIDAAMKPLNRNTKVYRGLSKSWEKVFGAKPEVGGRITDRAYMSTSHDLSVVEPFKKKGGVQIDILVPKGTPCSWLEDNDLGSEMILSRGRTLEIVQVIDDHHVVCKVVA